MCTNKINTISTVLTILLGLHLPKIVETTDNVAPSPAPDVPIDFLTRQIPSTPLTYFDNIKNNVRNRFMDGSGRSEYVVGIAEVSESSLDYQDTPMLHTENDDGYITKLPPEIEDYADDCQEWAEDGECNINPVFMLQRCARSCLEELGSDDDDLHAWGIIKNPNEADWHNCEDWHTIDVETGKVPPSDEGCEDWAELGLCKSIEDKDYMLSRCSRTCMVCIPPDEDEFDMGNPQEITDFSLWRETLDVMIETSLYMSETVMDTRNTMYKSVRRDCKNLDPLCAQYKAEGGCNPDNKHYEWMVLNCAPTCQTCELLDFSIRCPIPEDAVNALESNGGESGLNAMFERIVGERDLTKQQVGEGMRDLNYTSTIYSRPFLKDSINGNNDDESTTNIINGPWVVSLDNFLSDEECERLIEIGKDQGYEQSTETSTNRDGSEDKEKVSTRRTSTNTFCETCEEDPIARRTLEKIATITGFPIEYSEDLQLLHYVPGQYYKRHHDYIPAHKYGPSGPRVLTVLLYLNDVEEGGGTRFNELAEGASPIDVQPKKGSVLIWPSVLHEDVISKDDRTEHEALPVLKGFKYAANAWLHLRDEKNIQGIACG